MGLTIALWLAVLLGHAVFWLAAVNRLHGIRLPRKLMDALTLGALACCCGIPLVYLQWLVAGGTLWLEANSESIHWGPAQLYATFCLIGLAVQVLFWLLEMSKASEPAVLSKKSRSIDVARSLGYRPTKGWRAKLFSHVPGNQIFRLQVNEKEIELARWPQALDGLSILHLTDFHFSHRIRPEYFHQLVSIANQLEPDVIAVTGDICDVAAGIEWIGEVFGPLVAPSGKFFVLGNHDIKTKAVARVRAAMEAADFVDLSRGPRHVLLRGLPTLWAGNERPWFATPEPHWEEAEQGNDALRILLAHTPDQFRWAQSHNVDLMLTGHTHGGQVCLPAWGPLLCPSLHGTRYAEGTFLAGRTLMHVSRGVSNLFPLRLFCPPEMAKLIVRSPKPSR